MVGGSKPSTLGYIILTPIALYSGLERKTWANLLTFSPSIGTMVTICNQITVIM